jgi:hypothetical protein
VALSLSLSLPDRSPPAATHPSTLLTDKSVGSSMRMTRRGGGGDGHALGGEGGGGGGWGGSCPPSSSSIYRASPSPLSSSTLSAVCNMKDSLQPDGEASSRGRRSRERSDTDARELAMLALLRRDSKLPVKAAPCSELRRSSLVDSLHKSGIASRFMLDGSKAAYRTHPDDPPPLSLQDLLRLVDGVGDGVAHGDEAELQGYSLLGQGGGAQGCF